MSLNTVVLYGSLRTERQGIRAARFVVDQLRERSHQVTLVDPVERKLPMLDRMYKEYDEGQAPAPMEELAALYREADAFGGVRAAVQLRAVLGEVGLVTIPSTMPVPKVSGAFDEAGRPQDEAWPKRAKKFLDELEWYARALSRARKEGVPYS